MTNCVNCGQQISDGEITCPYCGAAQQPMMNWQAGVSPDMQGQQMGYDGQNMQQGYGQPMMNWQAGVSPEMQSQQMNYGGQNVQQGYGQQQMNPQMGYDGQSMQQGYGQPQGQSGVKKPVNGKKIGIIAGIVVVLALVIVLVIKFIGPGAPTQKAAIKSYVEAMIDQDADDFLDACFPKKLLKGVKKEYNISNDDFEDEIEYMMYWYADVDAVRKIKIIDKEEMDKSDVKDFEDEIKDEFNVNIKISELVRVEYEYEAKEDGEWEKDSETAILYKTGGKWFVMEEGFMGGGKNGTYELSEVSTMGVSFSSEEFEEISGQKLDMTLTVKGSNCTLSADMAGLGVVGNGTARITFSGDTVTIEDGRKTITGKYDSKEKTITLTSQGVDMVFKKK